jgi:hypothetical protein
MEENSATQAFVSFPQARGKQVSLPTPLPDVHYVRPEQREAFEMLEEKG